MITRFKTLILGSIWITMCSYNNVNAKVEDLYIIDTPVTEAMSVLEPTMEGNIRGKVSFIVVPEGVHIIADITGLEPGEHGFHIHEGGDCSAPGAHFNPTNKSHGGPNSIERHAGDFGNVLADEKGHAHYDRIDKIITLDGSHSIIGKSVIVHEKADDLVSQPTGNAGNGVACGVIEAIRSK